MRKQVPWLLLTFAATSLVALGTSAIPAVEKQDAEAKRIVREIYVPFEDLNVLLEGQPRRVLLSRDEYEELLRKAKKAPETKAPLSAVLVSADYTADIEQQRARLAGTLVLHVLEDGLRAVPLDLGGVGLRSAALDGKGAAIGRADGGRLTLFVEGKGPHKLALEIVAPVETTAAQQTLHFRLPKPPTARLRLTVPGDVEVKSGADVLSRRVEETPRVTRFELLPRAGDTTLVMSLNSRLDRRGRAVIARSVVVDEVTEAYERLHATVSLDVLHRAVDRFRFLVPEGFEITDVVSPLLARWAMEMEDGRRVLDVRLREQTTDTVVLNLSAIRTPGRLDAWSLPKLEPLDVVGQVAVVGLLVDERLNAESVAFEGLVPIDTSVLSRALPETILRAEPGAPTLCPVVAYYAPRADFELSARFVKPPAETAVTAAMLLILGDKEQQVRGGLALLPDVEKLFFFDFSVPAGWQVTSVTGPGEKPLAFERYGAKDEAGRIRVRLPQGVPPGEEYSVNFHAVSTPAAWLADWKSSQVEFPVFAVAGAKRDAGVIAVQTRDDMTVRPETVEALTPLDVAEKEQSGLAGVPTNLAYRYETPPYKATLVVERTRPRLVARTFSFLRVEPDSLAAHYEIVYQVDEARTRKLLLELPESTPEAVSIRALDGVKLKESDSEVAGGSRRWTVLLEEARRGRIRLAVDFQQPLAAQEPKDLALPIVRAGGVAYQSGLVAVEGSAELDVRLDTTARRVDVGELVDAEYQPGPRLLGAFGFVGDPAEVKISVFRHPGYRLHPTIVQLAELITHLSADRVSQTEARFDLRTKALFLEVRLPPGSELWSAELDGQPIKPQREGASLLMSLSAGAGQAPRSLRIVYQTPVAAVDLADRVELSAPKLMLRADEESEAVEVPLADFQWRLHVPPGYEVVQAGGTVRTDELVRPEPAAVSVVKSLYWMAGGVHGPFLLLPAVQSARESARRASKLSRGMAGRDMPTAAETPTMDVSELMVEEDREPAAMESFAAPEDKPAAKPAEKPAAEMDEAGKETARKDLGVEQAPKAVLKPPPGPPKTRPPEPKKKRLRKLHGVRSLKIGLEQGDMVGGQAITFRSLGVEPQLEVTLASRSRFDALGWGLALAVGLVGLCLSGRRARTKVRFVIAVLLVATLVPLVFDCIAAARVCNMAVYAAALLVPYYLIAGAVRWFLGGLRRAVSPGKLTATAAVLLAIVAATSTTVAAPPQMRIGPYVVQLVEPDKPVAVPEDAILLPYDPDSETGIEDADQRLVPYAKYVVLWNRAYPDKKLEAKRPPALYALSGASYTTTLEGDEYLLVEGRLEIDVFTEKHVEIPLALAGGVLARAELDGKPARLSVLRPDVKPDQSRSQSKQQQVRQQAANQAAAPVPKPQPSLVALYVLGKGRHELEVAVRLRLDRRGGWRVTEGLLPAAPASAISITVPAAETELRLGRLMDRSGYETKKPREQIETALGPGGAIGIQWRPKVAEGQVDRSLTARSDAVFDVQEDGLRLVWQLALEFRRSERDVFQVDVPKEYLVEKVEGGNVRGWEVRQEANRQKVEITLLKAARDREQFAIRMWRRGPVGGQELAEFDVPKITVSDAALHSGRLVVRRSPLLDLRAVSTSGVTRTDLAATVPKPADSAVGGFESEESPLGIRPFQAYRFVAMPFSIRLAATTVESRTTAEVQTVLKLGEHERSLESKINLNVAGRPIHRVEIVVPDDLELDDVAAPGEFQWAITRSDDRRLLTVYLASGQQGTVAVLVRGKLDRKVDAAGVPLPRIEVLGVRSQQGHIAVQVDPAYQIEARNLNNCEGVLLRRLYGWLTGGQRSATRLALHYRRADYSGTLRLVRRETVVSGSTITNVRVTDRAVEETILLDFTIRQAGIRELSFLLPAWMADCRINVPMLRQKTIEPVDDAKGSPLRVRLDLQDEVMNQLRVLVENDRLLERKKEYTAPIPVVETGRTDRQFVAIESAGREEVVVDEKSLAGLEPLGRQQKEWRTLKGILGDGITQAYLVTAGAKSPRLALTTKDRKAVRTAGARIGLAETSLVVDATGAYRGQQIYRLDNSTEQFLQIELPEGARLWTARVAGNPVKPTKDPAASDPRRVRIPLVKTAPGDLDYAVVLKYGGTMSAPQLANPVSFPLIHTRNINVELSQVRLFLPEEFQWFDFRGTMRLVGEEGDLAAGYVAYQTKLAERLVETMRHAGDFAKVRALSNYKNLKSSIDAYQELSSANDYFGNVQLREGLADQDKTIRQWDREVGQLEVVQDQAEVRDNRDRLNERFAGQKTAQASNVVGELGRNFSAPVSQEPSGTTVGGKMLSEKWLDKNKLSSLVEEKAKDVRVRQLGPGMDGKERLAKGQKRSGAVQAQPKAPQVAQGKAQTKLKTEAAAVDLQRERRRKQDSGGAVNRYQQRLEQQQANMPQQVDDELHAFQRQAGPSDVLRSRPGFDGRGKITTREIARPGQPMPGYRIAEGQPRPPGMPGPVPGGGEAGVRTDLIAPAGEVELPEGLASLDVTLPERGCTYFFTTPGGEVEITARAASEKLIAGLVHLATLIVVLQLAWIVVRMGHRGRFDWLGGRSGSTFLIGLGVLLLFFGVFPVAGLLAIVAGILIKIRQAIARPKPAEKPILAEAVEG